MKAGLQIVCVQVSLVRQSFRKFQPSGNLLRSEFLRKNFVTSKKKGHHTVVVFHLWVNFDVPVMTIPGMLQSHEKTGLESLSHAKWFWKGRQTTN